MTVMIVQLLMEFGLLVLLTLLELFMGKSKGNCVSIVSTTQENMRHRIIGKYILLP
jgi:hypothetical protein